MDFDYIYSEDPTKEHLHKHVKEDLMDTLRSFFNTRIVDIFEDEPGAHGGLRPRSTSCPRSVGARRRGSPVEDPQHGDMAVLNGCPSTSARQGHGGHLESRPGQNCASTGLKPRLVVSRGRPRAPLTELDGIMQDVHMQQKDVKLRSTGHRISPDVDKVASPLRQQPIFSLDAVSIPGVISPAGSTIHSGSPPSPGAGIINVVNTVVHGFSTIGLRATNLLNTLDQNFDQMFNPMDDEPLDGEQLAARRPQVVELLVEEQQAHLERQIFAGGPLFIPPSHTISGTMTRDDGSVHTVQGQGALPQGKGLHGHLLDGERLNASVLSNTSSCEKMSKANQLVKSRGQQEGPLKGGGDVLVKKIVNRKQVRLKVATMTSLAPVLLTSPQAEPTGPSPQSSPSSEQDCPKDQRVVRRKAREMATREGQQQQEAQSDEAISENERMAARIQLLIEENERLRSAELDPVDETVRGQLQQLLKEKSLLVEENARLICENRSLHELLAFTTDYAGLVTCPSPGGSLDTASRLMSPATLEAAAENHSMAQERAGFTTPLPPIPSMHHAPMTRSKYTDEVAAIDNYYSAFLLPPAPSSSGWEFLGMDLDFSKPPADMPTTVAKESLPAEAASVTVLIKAEHSDDMPTAAAHEEPRQVDTNTDSATEGPRSVDTPTAAAIEEPRSIGTTTGTTQEDPQSDDTAPAIAQEETQ